MDASDPTTFKHTYYIWPAWVSSPGITGLQSSQTDIIYYDYGAVWNASSVQTRGNSGQNGMSGMVMQASLLSTHSRE